MMKNPSLQSPQENPIKTDRIHGDVGKKILMISGSFLLGRTRKEARPHHFTIGDSGRAQPLQAPLDERAALGRRLLAVLSHKTLEVLEESFARRESHDTQRQQDPHLLPTPNDAPFSRRFEPTKTTIDFKGNIPWRMSLTSLLDSVLIQRILEPDLRA